LERGANKENKITRDTEAGNKKKKGSLEGGNLDFPGATSQRKYLGKSDSVKGRRFPGRKGRNGGGYKDQVGGRVEALLVIRFKLNGISSPRGGDKTGCSGDQKAISVAARGGKRA